MRSKIRDTHFTGLFMSRSRREPVHLSFRGLLTARKKLLKLSDLPYVCMYCGDPANQREHVTPYSYSGNNTHMVWSCQECNVLASDNLFVNIEEKGRYINERLHIKYKKLIDIPDWSEKEFKELDGNIKRNVKGMIEVQKWIKKRINWKVNPSVLLVMKAIQSKDIGSDSVAKIAEANGIPLLELRQLVSTEIAIAKKITKPVKQKKKCEGCEELFPYRKNRRFCGALCCKKFRERNLVNVPQNELE